MHGFPLCFASLILEEIHQASEVKQSIEMFLKYSQS